MQKTVRSETYEDQKLKVRLILLKTRDIKYKYVQNPSSLLAPTRLRTLTVKINTRAGDFFVRKTYQVKRKKPADINKLFTMTWTYRSHYNKI